MPTYEYRCDTCDRTFDVVQSFDDDPLTRCPTCDAPVRKVFGSIGIVFKGSGFYKTDSRNGSSAGRSSEKASSTADGAGSGDRSDGGSKGGEAKPDGKKSTSASESGSKSNSGSRNEGKTSSPSSANAS